MIVLVDPTAGTAGMRQRNRNYLGAGALDLVLASNQVLERQAWEEAFDGETPHRDEQPGPDESQLVLEPVGAVGAFRRRRHAITPTARTWTRITPGYCRDIDPFTRRRFVEANSLEPAEERLPGPARECATAGTLDLSWRLTHEHHTRAAGQ